MVVKRGIRVYLRDGQWIGEIKVLGGVKSFVTRRRRSHIMLKHQGFGLSKEVIQLLREDGVRRIVFEYFGKKESARYETTLAAFLESQESRVDDTHKTGDEQVFVSLREMIRKPLRTVVV